MHSLSVTFIGYHSGMVPRTVTFETDEGPPTELRVDFHTYDELLRPKAADPPQFSVGGSFRTDTSLH